MLDVANRSFQVLYHQSDPRNRCSGLRLCSTLQNGTPGLAHRGGFKSTTRTDMNNSDLPTNRLGRPTHPHTSRRRQRHSFARNTRNGFTTTSNYIQRLCIRRPPLEIHTPAERSASPTRRNGASFLHCHEQKPLGYYRSRNIQRHAWSGGAVFQQDPVFLFRGAEAQCRRIGRYASFLLYRPRFCDGPEYEGD